MKRKHQKQIFVSVAILFGFLFAIPNVAQQSQSPSANSVTSPTKNTSPATKTPTKQVNPKSTTTPATNSPSPSPTKPNNPSQKNSQPQKNPNFWQRNEGDLIKWTGTIITALLAGGVSIYGFRYNKKSKLEEIQLQHQLGLKAKDGELTKAAEAELKTKEERKNIVADCAEQYRQKIVTEMCSLSICNLPHVPSSLSLDSVYVELSVREEELLRYPNPSEIDSLAEGDPNKLLKKSQLYLTEKSTDAISPVEALVKFPQMVVLGDPGAGKTTMLRFLALKMAQRQEYRLPYLPLYVELGKFVQSETKDLL